MSWAGLRYLIIVIVINIIFIISVIVIIIIVSFIVIIIISGHNWVHGSRSDELQVGINKNRHVVSKSSNSKRVKNTEKYIWKMSTTTKNTANEWKMFKYMFRKIPKKLCLENSPGKKYKIFASKIPTQKYIKKITIETNIIKYIWKIPTEKIQKTTFERFPLKNTNKTFEKFKKYI